MESEKLELGVVSLRIKDQQGVFPPEKLNPGPGPVAFT
jgi:hypothetical protein